MSKRALLNEEVTRRMMKLANIGAVNAQNFITEAYDELEEGGAKKGDQSATHLDYMEEGGDKKGDQSATHLDYVKESEHEEEELHATEDELGAEDELADEEGAELDAVEDAPVGGDKEEQFKTIVDMLADLLDVDADVELEGGEELEIDTPEGDLEVEDEEEVDLMEALTARVLSRIEQDKQKDARKEQIAESVASRIMKRLES